MAEGIGRDILMIDAMVSGRVQREARAAMKIPITDIQPDQWYDLQDHFLAYQQAIADGFSGPIGLKIAGTRIMPTIKKQSNVLDAFTKPRELFEALDTLYQANNRGPDAGHFKAVETTDNSVMLEDTSPHLPELQLGVAEGIVKIFPRCFLTSSEILEQNEAKKVYKLNWKSR
jgi:hypothetical protein